MTQELISNVESNMKTSVNHLVEEFTKIRTGRANPSLVTNIQVDYYGTKTPLQQLASISVPDPKLLLIQPFDKGTKAVASVVARLTKEGKIISVAGGGDTVAALAQSGVSEDFSYISTAGGAFLEWMEGKKLPGVDVLRK